MADETYEQLPLFGDEDPRRQEREEQQRRRLENNDVLDELRINNPSRLNVDEVDRARSELEASLARLTQLQERQTVASERTAKNIDDELKARERIRNIERQRLETTERRERIETRMRRLEDEGINALREEARLLGVRDQGRYHFGRRFGQEAMTEQEFREMIAQRGGHPDYEAFRTTLQDQRMMQERRGRKTFSPGEVLGALAQGNIGAAVGELLQQPDWRATRRIMEQATRAGAAVEASSIPGAGMLGRAIPGVASYMLTPAAAYAAQRVFRQANAAQRQFQLEGMAGGLQGTEAIGETLRGRIQAFQMGGLNPFDIMTREIAREIARGVRSRGFRGEVAQAWTDSVGDVVSDLGINAGEALEAMNVAVDQLGMNAGEFREMMDSLDDVAKTTGDSVENVRRRTMDLAQALGTIGGTGAGAMAPVAIATIQGAIPRGTPARDQIAQAIGQRETLAALQPMFGTGEFVAPWDVEGQIRQISTILDNLKRRLLDAKPDNMPLASYASMLSISGAFGLQMSANAWEGFLQAGSFREAQGRAARDEVRDAEATARRRGGWRGQLGGIASRVGDAADWVSRRDIGLLSEAATIGGQALGAAGDIIGTDPEAGRRAYIREARRQLVAAGMSAGERQRLLGPMRAAVGDGGSFDRLANRFESTVPREITIRLEANPELRRLLRESPSAYNQYLRGEGGSQYSTPPPAIQPRNEQ
jgi:hypothetical protein